ncbi:uncharacterized protein CDAR_279251 [Caerostris darwini]|uniref:Uncharacterized protein n=1 Tax=Caerostris darwini TaxID=1538125 RepID=A0AAV4VLH5_9ARAC|nr:uncharacterized protein CDAR_279251 [Caerostris darwini]
MIILAVLFSISLVHSHEIHQAQPHKFAYSVKDKYGEQQREEYGNGSGSVKGIYGFTDAKGIYRKVTYVADHDGFRAQVKTNEPGTANQDTADVQMSSNYPYSRKADDLYFSSPEDEVEIATDPIFGKLTGHKRLGYRNKLNGYNLGYSEYDFDNFRYGSEDALENEERKRNHDASLDYLYDALIDNLLLEEELSSD